MFIFSLFPLQISPLNPCQQVSLSLLWRGNGRRLKVVLTGSGSRDQKRQKLISQRLLALGGPWRNAQGNCQIVFQMENLPSESAKEIYYHRICTNPLHWVKGEGGLLLRTEQDLGLAVTLGGCVRWEGRDLPGRCMGLRGQEQECHLWSSLCSHAGHGEMLSALAVASRARCYYKPGNSEVQKFVQSHVINKW